MLLYPYRIFFVLVHTLLWSRFCVFVSAHIQFFFWWIHLHFCNAYGVWDFSCWYCCLWYASVMWLSCVWRLFEVHDFGNHSCNNMYEHGFCMYAMICMALKLCFYYLRGTHATVNSIGTGIISNDRVQRNKLCWRIK